jgi:hypothetical protein
MYLTNYQDDLDNVYPSRIRIAVVPLPAVYAPPRYNNSQILINRLITMQRISFNVFFCIYL